MSKNLTYYRCGNDKFFFDLSLMMMNKIDDLSLQRLVDGRLSLGETQRLLQDASDHPDHWQRIATAFVEEQVWKQQIHELEFDSAQVVSVSNSIEATNLRQSPTLFSKHFLAWASVAALLILLPLTFLVGRNSVWNSRAVDHSATTVATASNDVPQNPQHSEGLKMPLAQHSSAIRTINAPYALESKSDKRWNGTPIMTQSMAEEINYRPTVRPISNEIQSANRKKGYELEPQIRYVQAKTNDGRSIILPIELVQIKKFGQ